MERCCRAKTCITLPHIAEAQSLFPCVYLVSFAKLFAKSPATGAETIVYLASSPEAAETTGRYFYKCQPNTPSTAAQDDRAASELWRRSAALADMRE